MLHHIKIIGRTVSQKGGIFTFLRAQLTSLMSSFTYLSITFILFWIFDFEHVYATFIGQVCGGVMNCIVNFRWTFKVMDVKKRYVAVRYLLIWCGSIFFNTYGVYLMNKVLDRIPLLESLSDSFYLVSNIVVSIIVGFVWNYNMHRIFVYKDLRLRRFFHHKEPIRHTLKNEVDPNEREVNN